MKIKSSCPRTGNVAWVRKELLARANRDLAIRIDHDGFISSSVHLLFQLIRLQQQEQLVMQFSKELFASTAAKVSMQWRELGTGSFPYTTCTISATAKVVQLL